MKKIIIKCIDFLIVTLVVALSVVSVNAKSVAHTSELGNINGDNSIDIADLVRLKNFFDGTADIEYRRADIDDNGAIDTCDFMYLKKYILGFDYPLPIYENQSDSSWHKLIKP